MARESKGVHVPEDKSQDDLQDSQHDMATEREQSNGQRGRKGSAALLPPGVREAMRVRTSAGAAMGQPERTKPGRTKVIQGNPLRVGKDEMNLIEHPFAALWQKEPGDAVISYQWTARHPDTGRELPASWMVAGSAEFGLPTPSDERVYLVLMELTREAEFKSPAVSFSRYDIIRRLGWTDAPQSYRMLQGAFDRLTGVAITAKNAFWSPKSRSYRNTGFHILEMYDIIAEPPGRKSARSLELPLSYFQWSEVIFDSFQDGYIRTLDLDFALSLTGDIALRLYRYLDKKAYDGRPIFEIDLFSLCIGHLGMKPSPFPSKLKERLVRPHDELVAKGFLRAVSFESTKGSKSVKVRYDFAKRPASGSSSASPSLASTPSPPNRQSLLPLPEPPLEIPAAPQAPATPVLPAGQLSSEERDLLSRMEAIRVSGETARSLLQTVAPDVLRVQLDCLEDREPRNSAATFVKAVREVWALPEKYLERQEAQDRAEQAKEEKETQDARAAQERASMDLKRAFLEEESAQLDTAWEQLDRTDREKLEAQARERLGVLAVAGRSQGALLAMRRNLLRERLKVSE